MCEVKISHSLRSMYRKCPRSIYYSYVAGIKSKVHDSPARAMGRAFHLGIQKIREDIDFLLALSVAKESLEQDLVKQLKNDDTISVDLIKLQVYLTGYEKQFGNNPKGKWVPEVRLETKTEKGFIDAIYKNADGELWIVEDKTCASLDTNVVEMLPNKQQLLNYYHLLVESGIENIKGYIYRESLKSRHKKRQNESLLAFSDRLLNEYMNNLDSKYRQTIGEFVPSQLESYKIQKAMTDIVINNNFRFKQSNCWAQNTDNCSSVYGLCDYFQLCHGNYEPKEYYTTNYRKPLDEGRFINHNNIGE